MKAIIGGNLIHLFKLMAESGSIMNINILIIESHDMFPKFWKDVNFNEDDSEDNIRKEYFHNYNRIQRDHESVQIFTANKSVMENSPTLFYKLMLASELLQHGFEE